MDLLHGKLIKEHLFELDFDRHFIRFTIALLLGSAILVL
jgi:hypothetical protein